MSKLGLVFIGIFTYVVLCYACTCKHGEQLKAIATPTHQPQATPSATPLGGATGKLYVWRQSGKVFLAGTVPSVRLKEILNAEAAKRYDVGGFVDKLSVASPEGIPELEWETIALKAVVWGGLGDISLDGKILTLKGTQPSEEAKRKRQEYIKRAIPESWGLVDEMKVVRASPTPAPSPLPMRNNISKTGNDTTPQNLQAFKAVEFRPGTAELTDQGRALLNRAAEVMTTAGGTRYEVGGHTDDLGVDAANLNISERRADAVRKHLMDQGIAPERLEAHGFGEARPLAPNSDETSRARNRRIEFTELK